MSLRISSLDYLGLVASRLRRDAVQSKLKQDTIDTIIKAVKVLLGQGCDVMGFDVMGWDGMGWDGMGWHGMAWDGMGWDGMGFLRKHV